MSGVEILGVLLGALPLCISAMEHYRSTIKTTSIFRRTRRAYNQDLRSMEDCRLSISLIVQQVLLPLQNAGMLTLPQYQILLASPGGPAWRDPQIDQSLREALGECYDSCMYNLTDMQDLAQELCRACGVSNSQFQEMLNNQASPPSPSWVTGENRQSKKQHFVV